MDKRAFLAAGLGLGLGLSGAARAAAPAPQPPAGSVPVRRVRTTLLTRMDGFPNAMDTSPEGIWIGEQTEKGGRAGHPKGERAWLVDPASGRVLRTVLTQAVNTSGMAFGDGHIWMMSNSAGSNGVLKTDMNSRTVSHRQIPLGPAEDGGGSHGGFYRDGKLWIMSTRLKGLLRVDPVSWTPEFMIPINTVRYHDIAWDNGAIWMIMGTSNGLAATNRPGMNKYDAATGRLLEQVMFGPNDPDPHGLTIHNGVFYACDAGISPGFVPSGSPSAQYLYRIDFVS